MRLRTAFLSTVVLLLISLSLNNWLQLSGPTHQGGFLIFTPHDLLWHWGVIAEVAHRGLPVQFPGVSGLLLTNYNYLADLFWGALTKLTRLPAWYFYLRWASWLSSSFFLLTIFWTAKKIGRSLTGGLFATLLVALGGTAAYLVPLFNQHSTGAANTFMLTPTIQNAPNLHTMVAQGFFFLSLYHFYLFFKKGRAKSGVWAGVFLGLLFGLKALYFAPFFLACLLITLAQLTKKRWRSIIPLIVGGGIFLLLLKVFTSSMGGGLPFEFRPGWLLEKMVENPERLAWTDRILRDQHYQATDNLPRLIISWSQKIALYLAGNLWLRWLGIIWLITQALKTKDAFYQLSLLTITISILAPLIVAPNPDHFNAVQMGVVGLSLSAFFSGIALKKKPLLFLIVFLLMIPTALKANNRNLLFINPEEYQALSFLKKESQVNEIVLSLKPNHNQLSLISGLAERQTFFSDTKNADLLRLDYKPRILKQQQLLDHQLSSQEVQDLFLKNKVSHLFTKKDQLSEQQITEYQLKSIYQNLTIEIFETGLTFPYHGRPDEHSSTGD